MPQNLDISYEQMRSLVLEVLRTKPADQFAALREAVAVAARERGLLNNDQSRGCMFGGNETLSGTDFARVQSIMWDLIIEGIVRPGLNEGMNNNLPFFHVTEWGKKTIKAGGLVPYDPDGHFDATKSRYSDSRPDHRDVPQ